MKELDHANGSFELLVEDVENIGVYISALASYIQKYGYDSETEEMFNRIEEFVENIAGLLKEASMKG